MNRVVSLLLVVIVGIGLLGGGVLYAGASCSTTMHWSLEVGHYGGGSLDNGSFAFRGDIGTTGSTGRPRIEDVTVTFYGKENTRLRSVDVGDFGIEAQRERNLTVTLPERPYRVEPQPRNVSAHPDTDWAIVGLEWTGERYDEVTLQEDSQPWYC